MPIFDQAKTSACVSCTAENCVHHSISNCCTAPHLEIGARNAATEQDTLCRTFCKKDSDGFI